MSTYDEPSGDSPRDPLPHLSDATPSPLPPHDVLAHAFQAVGMLVIHLGPQGIVLHCNAETTRVTGYKEEELVGRNFWGTLFPGRLFNQVPRFVSAVHPSSALAKDVPMTLRRKDGKERTVAWTRHPLPAPEVKPGESQPLNVGVLLVMGLDLTDRLTDADLPSDFELPRKESSSGGIFTEQDIDEFVTPLAITPPSPLPVESVSSNAAIDQAHAILATIEDKLGALQTLGEEFMSDERALTLANLRGHATHADWAKAGTQIQDFQADAAKMNRTQGRDLGSSILAMLMVCRSADHSKPTED